MVGEALARCPFELMIALERENVENGADLSL